MLLIKSKANGRTRSQSQPESFFQIKRLFRLTANFASVPQVFVGNTDNDSTKTNLFEPSIVAQYVRIIPVVCRRACTLRMELVGCELNGKSS